MTHRIVRAVRTCGAYPAQWDAWTDRGEYLYLRCRFGLLTVESFPEGPDWEFDSPSVMVAEVEADVHDLAEACALAGIELAADVRVDDVWPDYDRWTVHAEQQASTSGDATAHTTPNRGTHMTDSSIDALIAEGRRIHSAATPGTWHAWDRGVGWMIALDPDGNLLLPEGTRTDLDRRQDAEAIAWAHNHLPRLLDMLEQYREIARDRRDELVIADARIAELEDERDEALGRLDIERSRIQAAEYGAHTARETRNRMAGKLRAARARVAELEATPDVPEAWSNLIAAFRLLAKHPADRERPLHCEHDTLHVMADDSKFTTEEIAQLSEWDFDVDPSEGGFYSFRYGSA